MGTPLIGYKSALGTIGQSAETAANLCWLVAGLYLFSAVCQFVGVALIYNIDKKTLEKMSADLAARKAEELGITNKMTKQEQVFAVYRYVNSPDKSASAANIVFVDESNIPAIDRNNWETDWVEEAARTLQTGEGDCYSYYSVSKAFFEYLGIENKGIRRDDARSEMSGTHFWSMVNIGSTEAPKWYFYDGTRLAGKFPDGSKDGCLRTYDELMAYAPNNGQDGFYVFDTSKFPETQSTKIAR